MVLVSELRLSVSRDIFAPEDDPRAWGVYVLRDGWADDRFFDVEGWFESYAEAMEFVRSVIRCYRALITGSWVTGRAAEVAFAVALCDMGEPLGMQQDAS